MRTRDSFVWGSIAATACVAGGSIAHADLVVNGSFEDPTLAGISSDYLHTPGGNSVEGSWWNHPWDSGGPWFGTQHTPGGAGALSVNGDNSSQAGQKRVWYQSIAVVPGQAYQFSAWALATAAGFTGYSLRFAFDGVQVGGVISPTAAYTWEQFSTTIVATDAVLEISIVNVSGITFPNDFMLDDIALTPVETPCDLTGDGAVNGADLGQLLAAWGACGVGSCPADLNGTGTVDGADLGILLACWTN